MDGHRAPVATDCESAPEADPFDALAVEASKITGTLRLLVGHAQAIYVQIDGAANPELTAMERSLARMEARWDCWVDEKRASEVARQLGFPSPSEN